MITGREHLQKAYQDDQVAREYIDRRFISPLGALLHRRQTDVVRRLVGQHGIRRAVEIAPGPARVTTDVAAFVEEVTLVDASAQMLGEARRRLQDLGVRTRARFVQADAFKLPIRGAFDLAYTFRLIRHFERADRLALYRQIAGILKPQGFLVFDAVNEIPSAPLRAQAKPGEYEHYDALLRPDALAQELGEAGFRVVALHGVQHRYPTLMKCQIYLAPRSAALARAAMAVIDRTGGEPLEWVVVCRRE